MKTKHRPEWAANAFKKWHLAVCDHADPTSCGFEGQPWYQTGECWGRTSTTGKVVIFREDGHVTVTSLSAATGQLAVSA